ncbi:sorbosone dehydrogenase family protein [uncultured Methanomethylovorans sp.]|uniref:PQQ-dependent sugar dehydrogenase n=1 Tax=uncultured Methanomethylovorans sp. TaxID=183759 RepID=UPI00262B874F|nr:PQQ-dependent sugar dehydrogenase [uncultured Methanomethylovorans sp.]
MKWSYLAGIGILLLVLLWTGYSQLGLRPAIIEGDLLDIELPPGFRIEVFAEGLGDSLISYPGPAPGPRMMLMKDGILMVSIPNKGLIAVLPDQNGDHKADSVGVFIDGLDRPHGLDYYDGWFYIAEEDRVIRVKDADNNFVAEKETIEVLLDNIPTGGHSTRTVKVHNGSLYMSVGSSCNVCYETDARRAAITRCDLDGTNCKVFATGMRNAVGMAFHPLTGKLYVTENGRDWLGDDLPPDEINLVEEGKDYGWPVCYGKSIHDTDFDKNTYIRDPCEDSAPSLIDLQAHSAPLGLNFYYGGSFPEEYIGDLFVCLHGSWNRQEPTGYKIIRINMTDLTLHDFATGWLQDGNVLGRPVDVMVSEDGSLFVSDDNDGRIYRIYYAG